MNLTMAIPNKNESFPVPATSKRTSPSSSSMLSTGLPFIFTPAVVARIPHPKNQPMPAGFEPGKYDVICGLRGKQALQHVGNRRFRVTIAMNAEKYFKAPTKLDKSLIVIEVVDAIRNGGGNFVKRDRKTKKWVEIGDQLAREKVGHALRDHISAMGDRKNMRERSNSWIKMLEAAQQDCPSSPETICSSSSMTSPVGNMKQPPQAQAQQQQLLLQQQLRLHTQQQFQHAQQQQQQREQQQQQQDDLPPAPFLFTSL